MKKLYAIILSIFIPMNIFALVLPEGTNARIVDLKQERGKIVSATLKSPTVLNTPLGKVESKDKVEFYTSGSVKSFVPVADGSFKNEVLDVLYCGGREITFYESGCIKSCELADSVKIDGRIGTIPVQEGQIEFYDNWIPKSLSLSADTEFHMPAGNASAAAGSTITFYPSGRLESFYAKDSAALETSVGKVYVLAGSLITAHKNAKIKSLVPEDLCLVTLGENTFFSVPETTITFASDGSVKSFETSTRDFKLGSATAAVTAKTVTIFLHNDTSFSILTEGATPESSYPKVSLSESPAMSVSGLTVTQTAILPWSETKLYRLPLDAAPGSQPEDISALDLRLSKNRAAFISFMLGLRNTPFDSDSEGKVSVRTKLKEDKSYVRVKIDY